jgi:periplasmic protein TonB
MLHGAFACLLSIALHLLALWGLTQSWHTPVRGDATSLRIELSLAPMAPGASAQRPPPPMPRRAAAEIVASTRDDAARGATPLSRRDGMAHAADAPTRSGAAREPTAPTDARSASVAAAAISTAVSAARESAAVMRLAPPAALASAQAPAGGAVAQDDQARQLALEWRVQQWLAQFRKYPRAAARAGYQGTVMVRFVLDRDGSLLASELIDSSGHALLDRAALELLDRAAPFPPLPSGSGLDEVELVLPIDYRLQAVASG